MAHALAADLCPCYLNAALIAHHALIAHALIAAAMALPILCRPEYTLAEQSVHLWL